MKILQLTSIFLVLFSFTTKAQILGRTGQAASGFTKDKGYVSINVTLLGGGFTGWAYNFVNEDGEQADFLNARGRGLNTGPHIFATYTFHRLSLGVDAGYTFFFMRELDEPLVPENIRNLESPQRQLFKVGGKIMYDLIGDSNFRLNPNLVIGTFWFTRDDFNETAENRLYGKIGISADLPLSPYIRIFAEPHYAIFNYSVANMQNRPSTSMHNFNINFGLAVTL